MVRESQIWKFEGWDLWAFGPQLTKTNKSNSTVSLGCVFKGDLLYILRCQYYPNLRRDCFFSAICNLDFRAPKSRKSNPGSPFVMTKHHQFSWNKAKKKHAWKLRAKDSEKRWTEWWIENSEAHILRRDGLSLGVVYMINWSSRVFLCGAHLRLNKYCSDIRISHVESMKVQNFTKPCNIALGNGCLQDVLFFLDVTFVLGALTCF